MKLFSLHPESHFPIQQATPTYDAPALIINTTPAAAANPA